MWLKWSGFDWLHRTKWQTPTDSNSKRHSYEERSFNKQTKQFGICYSKMNIRTMKIECEYDVVVVHWLWVCWQLIFVVWVNAFIWMGSFQSKSVKDEYHSKFILSVDQISTNGFRFINWRFWSIKIISNSLRLFRALHLISINSIIKISHWCWTLLIWSVNFRSDHSFRKGI